LDVLAQEWAVRADTASFERAYLNVWPRPSTALAAAGLDLQSWADAAAPTVAATKVVAVAFDVSADRSAAAVATAGPDTTGRLVVEVVASRPGVGWLAGAVRAERAAHRGAVVVADSLVAASTVAELRRVRVNVDPVGASAHAQACGAFVDALSSGALTHRSQAVLDDAVLGAARRPLGDAWLWSRAKSSADISPLVACTLAAWAAQNRRPAGRPLVVSLPVTRDRDA
jgi:hypothetical protein